jgi:hypothetical protein
MRKQVIVDVKRGNVMKSLLGNLTLLLAVLQAANAASTETIERGSYRRLVELIDSKLRGSCRILVETKKRTLFHKKNLGTGYGICAGAMCQILVTF